jgi:hypothetical protein
MAAADIAINIAAQFTGKNAFQKADTATAKLQKSVKTLGRSLGIALGTAAIVNFGKQSVKAFAADEKAARSLSLALANTGNAFAQMDVEGFIQKLQRTTGVLDDELRPAFRTLITATGDVKKSQDALSLALDISRGTGKDLSAVSTALAKGFSGQTTALSRLGAGLSKATLASGDMDLITSELQKKFAGQALEATKGFAGQMDLLTVSVNNAKEAIGKGLVEALGILTGGSGGVGGAVGIIDKMASGIADGAKNIAFMIKQFEALKPVIIAIGALLLLYFAPVTAAVAALTYILAKGGANLKKSQFAAGKIPGGMGNVAMTGGSNQDQQKYIKLQKEKNALLKIENTDTKDKLKLTAGEKALAELKKIFDIEGIQLQAALNNGLSKEEEARVKGLIAINNSDGALALQALSAIKASEALDTFGLAAREAALKLQTSYSAGLQSFKQAEINSVTQSPLPPSISQGVPVVPQSPLQSFRQNEAQYASTGGVTIQINPAVAGLIDVIQNQSASGISPTVNRISSSYIA